MQRGTVEKHGNGWRGRWREDGKQRATRTVRTRSEALRLVKAELQRVEQGTAYVESVTYDELCERFLAQHNASDRTLTHLEKCLVRSRRRWGSVQARDVTEEDVKGWLQSLRVTKGRGTEEVAAATPGTRYAYLAAMRQVYVFAVKRGLVMENPASATGIGNPGRTEQLLPFESWAEVEQAAEEMGRWRALVVFAVDCGARPGELARLEHRHVDAGRVYLPGTKTRSARRIVHLTARGRAAYDEQPRAISTPLVWHDEGAPLVWDDFRRCVWHPGLRAAGLERRSPYQLRHTFAYFSLRAGVPISDLSVEMGHGSISTTHNVYGHWSDEMGQRAADLRAQWSGQAAVGRRESGEEEA